MALKMGVGGTRALAHSGDASPFRGVAKRIALATRRRAGAADLFENPSGCWGFHVFGGSGWEKGVKFEDAFWRSLLNVFCRFLVNFHIFLVLSTRKNLVIYNVFVPLASKKASDNMLETA